MYKTALWSVSGVNKMKPLSQSSSKELLERLDSAKESELREITMMEPTSFKIELSVQDSGRGYDWTNIAFLMSGVLDANLVDDSKLSFLNTSDGISIVFEEGSVGFANSECDSLSKIRESQLYLIGSSIKYEELPFREL